MDIKLKATNEQTKKTNKKLTDTNTSMVVTGQKGGGRKCRVKGVKYMVAEDLTFGGGHTVHYRDHIF